MDAVVLCLYTAEAAARIFALGFIGHKHAYAASVYNQVDFLIIVVSWLSMAMRRRGIDSMLARVRIGQLRLFRGVHALKQFKLATSVVFIAESLQKSISLLRDVAAVTVVCAVFTPSWAWASSADLFDDDAWRRRPPRPRATFTRR